VEPIAVERNVWIGTAATVLPGVTIGADSVVASGAVVTHDVPPATLVAGVPATVVRYLWRRNASLGIRRVTGTPGCTVVGRHGSIPRTVAGGAGSAGTAPGRRPRTPAPQDVRLQDLEGVMDGVRRFGVVALIPLVGVVALGCGSSVTTTKPTATSPPTTAVSTTTTAAPTPTTAAPPTTAASGRPCTSGQLSVATGSGQGAMGTEILPLVFTNTGSAMCTLQGYPGVSAVIANGVQLGPAATRANGTSTPLVALEPGQTTQATFTYGAPTNICPNPTTALGLRVYPPDQTAALFVATTEVGQCPSAPYSTFTIYPIGASPGH